MSFVFMQHYSIIRDKTSQSFTAKTVYYAYGLEDSQTGHEIFAYHWHPKGPSRVRHPHLHLEQGALIGRPELSGRHLPTGHVALRDVLIFLIEEFSVKPGRKDWKQTLEEKAEFF